MKRTFFFFCSGSFRQSSAQHCGHGNLTKVQARSAIPAEKQQKAGKRPPTPNLLTKKAQKKGVPAAQRKGARG